MKVFAAYDTEGSGSITFANLRRVAKELGENLTDDELQEMLNHADKSGNGSVSKDDFYRLMTKQTGTGSPVVASCCLLLPPRVPPVIARPPHAGNKLDDLLGDD